MKKTISDIAARCKRVLPGRALFICLVVAITLALVYKSRASILPAGIANPSSSAQEEPALKETRRQAVVHWMADNSAMPEKILSDIYGVAAGSVHTDLVLAVCLVESNYNPNAVSNKGAIGLMGIMPGIWLDELKAHGIVRGKEDLYRVENNMAAGTYVLESYISKTGNLRKALIRYEGGDSWYATRVLKAMRKISEIRQSQGNIYLASALN